MSSDEDGVESRAKMLRRHKGEVLKAQARRGDFRSPLSSLLSQKAAASLGKKRADEGAALLAATHARHAAELAAADSAPAEPAAVEPVAAALEATTLADEPADAGSRARSPALPAGEQPANSARRQKPSKAQQRRAKQAREEARRIPRLAG